jgi:shikimate 5-dehydrogenase
VITFLRLEAAELHVDSVAWTDVAATEADLYVNATPVGSAPGDLPALPASVLVHRPLVFDCVYRRDGSETPTVAAARAARCAVVDGLALFSGQAARQARLFGLVDATVEEISGILPARRAA